MEIVFYEKCDKSNIPYIIPEDDQSSDQLQPSPIPRDTLRSPYALKEHKMNYIRLPASEDINEQKNIEKLQDELLALKYPTLEASVNGTEKPKAAGPKKESAPFLENLFSDNIELIADDPFLVREHDDSAKVVQDETQGNTVLPRPRESQTQQTSTHKFAAFDMEDEQRTILTTPHETQISSESPKEQSIGDIRSDAPYVESSSSSDGVYVVVESVSDIMSEPEEFFMKRLNLSRNEMYVTGLYNPREDNAVSFEEKLHKVKQLRLKERSNKEKRIFTELKEKTPFDLSDRFKTLGAKKEISKRRSSSVLRIPDTVKISKVSESAQDYSWNEYTKDQENIELDSALINGLETGILRRLAAYIESDRVEVKDDSDVKAKTGKNKSKNNPADADVYARRSELVHEALRSSKTQLFSKNFNINATKKTLSRKSSTLKLPAIQNNNRELPDRKKGRDKSPTLLPLLTNSNHQRPNSHRSPGREKDQAWNIRMKNNNTDRASSDENEHKQKTRKDNENNSRVSENTLKISPSKTADVSQAVKFHDINHKRIRRKSVRLHLNKNQNRSADTPSTLEDNSTKRSVDDDTKKKSFGDETKRQSGDVSASSDTTRMDTDEEENVDKKSSCSSYSMMLKLRSFECRCLECADLEDSVEHDDEDYRKVDYPPILGRLRQDFSFLRCKNYIPKGALTFPNRLSRTSQISHNEVCDIILMMMNTVMIRKEILTSSLGYSYITITFTKFDAL